MVKIRIRNSFPAVYYPDNDWKFYREWQTMHNSDEMFKFMIDRETLRQIDKAAKLKGMSRDAFLQWCVVDSVQRVLHLENISPQIFP